MLFPLPLRICFGSPVLIETYGPDSSLHWVDAPHLLIPGMGRVSTDADNQGITLEIDGATAAKAWDREAGAHLGAGRGPGCGSTRPLRGELGEVPCLRPGICSWHAGHLGLWGQAPP